MKALIVYDSAYGNTQFIAETIASSVSHTYHTKLVHVDDARDISPRAFDLLIVGSPTQGGRATVPIQEYIRNLPKLHGMPCAVFDTRFASKEHGMALRLLMRTIGFAADKMAANMESRGAELVVPPVGFIVQNKTGPLAEQELDRAREWADTLMQQVVGARASTIRR